uniref:Uncharacterized protein n=1 Tax=Chlamydia muridarum (strain MoPn / Nigg) TaxID=243161 RepID=Q9PLR8_CHLMU
MDTQSVAGRIVQSQGAFAVSGDLKGKSGAPSDLVFDGPLRTLDQLKNALIIKMGEEKGLEMYDQFINSLLVSVFSTMRRGMDRAQRASKRMRAAM